MKAKLVSKINNKRVEDGLGIQLLRVVFEGYAFCKDIYRNHFVSDKKAIKIKFKRAFGYTPDVDHPKTLNEKIQWLKLNDRTNLHTLCSDKFKVREWIKQQIGAEYLVPLVFETKDVEELNVENMPDYPVIIKTNHDSSGGIIVRDKNKVDWLSLQKHFKHLLKQNYYAKSKEWQYKNIEPRLVIEKLLSNKNGEAPYDYKVHCFNKKPITIQVDIDRGRNHKRNWYSTQWQREPFYWSSLKEDGEKTDPATWDVNKPKCLDKILALSEKLSQEFLCTRADWYIVDTKLYFGELSFHHDGGLHPILPKEWDLKLGNMLKLPIDE